jgi:hypothetical protein
VTFYGLAESLSGTDLGEVIELYVRRQDAEQALSDVLRYEPKWECELSVVRIELGFSNQ